MAINRKSTAGGRGGGSPPQDRKIHGGSSSMDHRDALDKIVIKNWRWWRLAAVLLAVIWLGCLLVAIPASASAPTAAFSSNVTGGLSPLPVQFTDSSTGSPTGWVWFFGDEGYTQPWHQMTSSAGWVARSGHSMVVTTNGTLVLMGGYGGGRKNDTWVSYNNGTTWTQINASSGWSTRYGQSSNIMPDGSIVLMGGQSASTMNDVWQSFNNGTTWNLLTASAGWPARFSQNTVVMPDGSLVLIGGYAGAGGGDTDVWRSTNDGATWTQLNASAFTARYYQSSVVLPDGSIVMTGGLHSGTYNNETWVSPPGSNGAIWNKVNASSGWYVRDYLNTVAMPDNSIVLMGGGNAATYYNDVWRSTNDGATWTQINTSAGWSARTSSTNGLLPNGSVILAGGQTTTGGAVVNDVWSFNPVGSFSQSPSHTYTGTAGQNFNVSEQVYKTGLSGSFNDLFKNLYITLYAVPSASFTMQNTTGQGYRYATFTDTSSGAPNQWNWSFQNVIGNNTQVWWSQAQNPTLLLPPGNYSIVLNATNPAGVSISSAQWVNVSAVSAAFSGSPLSGVSPLTTTFTDASTGLPSRFAWFFGDESYKQPWINTTGSPVWSRRGAFPSVVLPDGNIIITGGALSGIPYNDTYRSTDEGVTWQLMNASSGWPARSWQGLYAVPDGSLVLTGGRANGTIFNDTWRSTDEGATWTQINASSGYQQRDSFEYTTLPDGHIVVIGGAGVYNATSGTYINFNDTWMSSDDGYHWKLQSSNPAWEEREGASAVALLDGSIIQMGGIDSSINTAAATFNDTWRSTDEGVTWQLMNASSGWSPRLQFIAVPMPDNSVVLTGGGYGGNTNYNDVWRSTNEGSTWSMVNSSAGFTQRYGEGTVSMPDGSIIVMGGQNYTSPTGYNDTWRMQPVGSNLQNPSHTYVNTGGSPVTYNVSETVWNAASGWTTLLKSQYIAQNSLGPIASFTQNITQGYSPLVVQFSDTSSYGTSNFWNFGDGTNATSTQFPVHTYTSTGQYTVTLTETNSYGSSTATGKVLVNVIATPTPTPTPTPQTNNLSVWKRIA
jgi:PKD repeat protein